jgi:hypothetical protein
VIAVRNSGRAIAFAAGLQLVRTIVETGTSVFQIEPRLATASKNIVVFDKPEYMDCGLSITNELNVMGLQGLTRKLHVESRPSRQGGHAGGGAITAPQDFSPLVGNGHGGDMRVLAFFDP